MVIILERDILFFADAAGKRGGREKQQQDNFDL